MIKLHKQKARKGWPASKLLILVPIIVLLWGCPSESQPKECVEFFNKESTNRLREFDSYDLEKQLIIHRCGLDWHPQYDRSYEIADRGKSIIPSLLEKLEDGNYKNSYDAEKTKYGIVLIFQRLASRGQLNENNQAEIKILENAVSEIKTNWIRKEADQSLVDIKKNVGV